MRITARRAIDADGHGGTQKSRTGDLSMKKNNKIKRYAVLEINDILAGLREKYDIVRLVDVEECRILDVTEAGDLRYQQECFHIWGRQVRCKNCSSLRACLTHCDLDKTEFLGVDKETIHSIPIYLELLGGEQLLCVIECVKFLEKDPAGAKGQAEVGDPSSYVSTHDVLTRLYTAEKLSWEIRRRLLEDPEGEYLLVMLNIRNFTLVNRLFGVEVANRLLVGMADLLRKHCGPEDIYGRYRDDRFAVLTRQESFREEALADDLRALEALVKSPIYAVVVKAGVYVVPRTTQLPVTAMMEKAELAVSSIRDDRDRSVARYEPGMLASRLHDQRVVADFERALRDGEFQIYLQPQVRGDGMVYGAEALVRWAQPDGRVLLPMEFLDVLQRSELLSHLDLYVWDLAARQLAAWKDTAFRDLYISINVDPTDFYHLDVPTVLAGLCQKYGLESRALRVEITETALVEDIERHSRTVERLHEAGFIVEIDDFGKGYSSLSLLKDIPADVLKIDMGFTRGEDSGKRTQVILESVIGMAANLNMDVITEGVETREQLEQLSKMGCRGFQGFYFSRPITVADFEKVTRENLLRET